MKTITDFEIVDHGIEHAQYFQGCGTAGGFFHNVVTGCGTDAAAAFDDCLDTIAMDGFDVSAIEGSAEGQDWKSQRAQKLSVEAYYNTLGEKLPEEDELYYYVSVRWN